MNSRVEIFSKIVVLIFFIVLHTSRPSYADDFNINSLSELSLDELLNQIIETPSNKPERVFDSPLSSTVLTREVIESSGATSIPEALRLIPGVIVREQTNGNYDVHVRGFDYLPEGSILSKSVNSLTLVKIDNRVVYNYFNGGTFWESLPIDIGDIDRIEVVRGPASVLHGPNAVTGVIQIFTRALKKDGPSAEAHLEGGRYDTGIASARSGYRWGEQLSVQVSANGQTRDRKEVEYYSFADGTYKEDPAELDFVTAPRPLTRPGERYPDPEKSLERAAANLFVDAAPTDDTQFEFDAGLQDSSAISVYHDIDSTPLTASDTNSFYLHSKNKIGAAGLIASYLDGERNVQGAPEHSFDFRTFDVSGDYLISQDSFTLLPRISYRRLEYGGSGRFEQADPSVDLWAGSLRGEWQVDQFTSIAGIRTDKYDYRGKFLFSYEGGVHYQPTQNHSIRTHYGRAMRSPVMEDTFQVITFPIDETSAIQGLGNENLDPVAVDTLEIGWRARLSENVETDLEVFWSRSDDYAAVFPDGTAPEVDGITYTIYRYQQLDIEAEQWGSTASLLYASPENSLTGRLFLTLQRTHLSDNLLDPADPNSVQNGEHKNTPNLYGGFYVNWGPVPKWNFNLSGYCFSDTVQVSHLETTSVGGKALINFKTTYALNNSLEFFFNARNLLNNDNREFANTDRIDGLYLAGVEVALN